MTRFFPYIGSKHAIAEWLWANAPRLGIQSYTEAYVGSGVFLTNTQPFKLEAINDKAGEIVNLYRVARDRGDELKRALDLTPWAADEFDYCQQPTADPLERARRFYFHLWASIRQFGQDNPTFKRQYFISDGMGTAVNGFRHSVDGMNFITRRLKNVVIENMDALDFLAAYDHKTAVHLIDPPYPFNTRANRSQAAYPVELAPGPGEEDETAHRAIAARLHGLQGHIVLCGYACELYKELYEDHGWVRIDREARVNGGGSKIESIWLPPHTVRNLRTYGTTISTTKRKKTAVSQAQLTIFGG